MLGIIDLKFIYAQIDEPSSSFMFLCRWAARQMPMAPPPTSNMGTRSNAPMDHANPRAS